MSKDRVVCETGSYSVCQAIFEFMIFLMHSEALECITPPGKTELYFTLVCIAFVCLSCDVFSQVDKLNIEVTFILPLVKGVAVSHGKVHDYRQWEFWGLVHQSTVFWLKVIMRSKRTNLEFLFKTMSHVHRISL